MRHTVLSPFGARIDDADIATLTAQDVEDLRTLLAEHGFVVFADQRTDDSGFVGFLRSLGPLTFTKGETPVDGHPDLNVVSNVGRDTPPKSNFHVDTSYVAEPPAYTALRVVTLPEHGGATLFTNQFHAFDTLPDATRRRLDGRVVTHIATGVELGPDDEMAADHPLFRPHPLTERTALYLSTAGRCAAISGMDADEAAETVAELLAHSTREEVTYRHEWSAGDVVIWDNSVVLHRADHSDVQGDRVLHRGMVATHAPAKSRR